MATKAKCPSGYTLKNGKCIGKDGKEVSAPYVSESGGFYPDQESLTSGCAKNPNSPKCQKIISTMSPEQRAKIKGIQKLGGSTKKYKKGGAVKKYDNGGNTGNQKRTNTYEQTKTGYTGPGSDAMSINDIKATTSKTNRKGNTVTKTFTGSGAQAGDVSGKGTRLKNAASGTKTKTVTDAQGNVIKSKTKNISGNRATKKILNIRDRSNTSESYGSAPGVYKTGGMVNPNAKLKATKSPGSKGVKPSVNPKASASKTAKKPSASRSKAPKKATPGRR